MSQWYRSAISINESIKHLQYYKKDENVYVIYLEDFETTFNDAIFIIRSKKSGDKSIRASNIFKWDYENNCFRIV